MTGGGCGSGFEDRLPRRSFRSLGDPPPTRFGGIRVLHRAVPVYAIHAGSEQPPGPIVGGCGGGAADGLLPAGFEPALEGILGIATTPRRPSILDRTRLREHPPGTTDIR